MFRASSCTSSEAPTTAVAVSGLPSELGGSSAVGCGRAGRPDHNQQRQGRSPAEILGSNPTGGMDICLLWVSCVVR